MISLLIITLDVLLITGMIHFIRGVYQLGKVAPFIRTRESIAKDAAALLSPLPSGAVVYDPGCGDARVLRAILDQNPDARGVGIELRLFPYILGRIRSRKYRNLRLVRGDLFDQDFSPATHLYTYLYPHVLDELLPKLTRELSPGTKLLSLDFRFKDKEPVAITRATSSTSGKLGTQFFSYEF